MLGQCQVVNPNADAQARHAVQQAVPIDSCTVSDQHGVEVVRMPGSRSGLERKLQRRIGQGVAIHGPDVAAPFPVAFYTRKLVDPERGLQVHHVVFETAFDDGVVLESGVAEALPSIRTHAMEGKALQPLCVLGSA